MEHIVDFGLYCPKCKLYKEPESNDICNDCLNNPVNEDSRRPIHFKSSKAEKTGDKKYA